MPVAVAASPLDTLLTKPAAVTPDLAAVMCDNETTSYGLLDRTVSGLTTTLRRSGVGPETIVAIHGQKSVGLLAAILATLRSGAAYLPIEAGVPAARVRQMIEQSGARVAFLEGSQTLANSVGGVPSIPIDVKAWTRTEPCLEHSMPHPENLALIVHTSGSTGVPKAVGLTRAAINRRLTDGYPYREFDLQKASIGAVAHISDLLLPLHCGATVRLINEAAAMDMRLVARWLRTHGSSRVVLVPSQLDVLIGGHDDAVELLRGVDTIVVGGDAMTARQVEAFQRRFPWITLHNGFGLSETTGIVSLAPVSDSRRIVVGEPLAGTAIAVVDAHMREVATGEVGEVCVSGPLLARGYLGSASQTAERFTPNPLAAGGQRLYRTGDLGRRHDDGSFELLGRGDRQVKVRGHRVSLPEIEQAIERHDAVARAAVVLQRARIADRLAAYVVLRAAGELDDLGLSDYLREYLPHYMLPSVFHAIDRLPLMRNGKVDYRALERTRTLEPAE